MILSNNSISCIANLLTGNSSITPSRDLNSIQSFLENFINCQSYEEFCNNFTSDDELEKLLEYTKRHLSIINGSSTLTKLVENIFNSPAFFIDKTETPHYRYDILEAISSVNSIISNDNYEIFKAKTKYRVFGLNDALVDYQCLFCKNKLGSYVVIKDHLEKCYQKINNGDYSGAITNARTLVEQILREIEISLNPDPPDYDGSLPRLYRRVIQLMSFEDGMSDNIKTIYNQILGGLSGSINGFSGLRNTMSDSHPIERIPSENDALLAVNEAKTIANFIVKHYFEKFVNAA